MKIITKFFTKKLLGFEKRLLLAFLIISISWLIIKQGNYLENEENPALIQKKVEYVKSLSKLKNGSDWKPHGIGTNENIARLPKIQAAAVINIDDGQVLWSQNIKEKVSPASLIKLVTIMTALDIAPLNKIVVITEDAADQVPTKLALNAGERLTLEEAASAAILTSANDSTEAIAQNLGEEIGQGTPTFMELVNKKLEIIGANDSKFLTSTGLDAEGQYSTVYDLAIIAYLAKTNYPLISKLAALEYQKLPQNSNHRLIDLPNWNALLGTYPGVNGLKIGYSENAGYTTIVTAERDGKYLMTIVIGARTLEEREIAAAVLLNYGFSKFGIEPFDLKQLNLIRRYQDWQKQLSQTGGQRP